jgi:hypothetical protein
MPQLPQEAGVGHANAGGLPWNRILARCHGPVQDVVLVPGCAPLLWSYVGLHSFLVPALTADKIASMVGEIVQPPGLTVRVDGYLGFDVRFGADVQFRVAVFGEPSPSFVIVMRLPAKVADRVPGRP